MTYKTFNGPIWCTLSFQDALAFGELSVNSFLLQTIIYPSFYDGGGGGGVALGILPA